MEFAEHCRRAANIGARRRELRDRFRGVVFVGDSQTREIAWGALHLTTPRAHIRFEPSDTVLGKLPLHKAASACVSIEVSKSSFTAACTSGVGGACTLSSPLHNVSKEDLIVRTLPAWLVTGRSEKELRQNNIAGVRFQLSSQYKAWDGRLALSPQVYSSDFLRLFPALDGGGTD